MVTDSCKICGEKVEKKTIQLSKRWLKNHIKKLHNMEYKNYVIKFDYNGEIPTCACGCGEETNFSKGKFFKYYKDHKNNVIGVYKNPKKNKKEKEIIQSISYKISTLGLCIEDLKNSYKSFINFDKNLTDISKELCLDKRTFKKYWKILGFIENEENFKRICKKHQVYWSTKKENKIKKINEQKLLNLYTFLSHNKNRYTIKELKDKFDIKYSVLVIYKRLCENFGESEVKNLIKYGNSSKPEIEFYNVLKYFFGNNLKKQHKLEGKIYDMLLLDDILIEFDGDYWHSIPENIKNDKIKNEIAKRNGFDLIRIRESESNNLDILKKIIRIYENKICRSK